MSLSFFRLKPKHLMQAALGLIAAYFFALGGIYFLQRDFLFVPELAPASTEAPAPLREIDITTEDGLKLKSWYAPATSKPLTIVFFHGNADSLASMAFVASPYVNAGYGFLAVEYRGYPGMPGSPSETGLFADARANINHLIRTGLDPKRLIVFGHSLGTGVAVQMAKEFTVGGVLLLAPYSSITNMAAVRFPLFPVKYLAKDPFDSIGKIENIHTPLLIANGNEDIVIPPSQGRALFDRALEPKQFVFVPGGGHNDLFDNPLFLTPALDWLQKRCAEVTLAQRRPSKN